MRRILLYIVVCICFIACVEESDEAKLQQLVVKSVTALHEGDIDTYLQAVDYGTELDSLHENLIRQMLTRYANNISRYGGLELVEANTCTIENDSIARVGYVLAFKDGTRESRIAQLVRMADGWKIVESF
jgi:hypothetical protein